MRTASLAFFALTVLLAPAAASAASPPVEAFGKTPNVTSVVIDPDGAVLAWFDDGEAGRKVVVFDLAERQARPAVEIGPDMTLRSLEWADNETLLLHVSVTHGDAGNAGERREWLRTLAVDAGGGEPRMLLMGGTARSWVASAAVLALRTPKPKTVIMSSWDLAPKTRNTDWVLSLFSVDTRTGAGWLTEAGTRNTLEWVVDGAGAPVARSEWNPETRVYRILRKDGRKWTEIHRNDRGDLLRLHGVTQDGAAVIGVGRNGQARSKAWAIPLDGSGARVALEDATRDIESIVRDPYSGTPVGAWVGGAQPGVLWLDFRAKERHEALSRTFAGRDVRVTARSRDGLRIIARVASQAVPATYYLVDLGKGSADIVGEEYPALAKATLGDVRTMSYKARDGAAITAYLTLPPQAAATDLPLVVLPHAGPHARDEAEFDWTAQFLATRGYAVLQPQFRGSTGFGAAHRDAGYRQWGGLMQDDLTDGVKALIAAGTVDPGRVCIIGVGYGGYTALAGAAFTPDLYACAASINGVADLPTMIAYAAEHFGGEGHPLAYWRNHIGDASDPALAARSPARTANGLRAPILLLHASGDAVVPASQSETMARELDRLDKPHTFLRLDGDDHWLSRSSTRIRVLQELEKFLALQLDGS